MTETEAPNEVAATDAAHWIATVPLAELTRRKKTRGEVRGRPVALYLVGDRVFALDDVCVHKGRSLSRGVLWGGKVVCPGHQWTFDPESGQEVGVGERGELWVKGPNVMVGYLNNSEATDATKDAEGYLHTGDVAVIDDEGVYSIVDRVKELIKYKGYQVPPAELEALLLTHDKIADTAVIGVKDAEGEEVPKAFVVKQGSGADLTEDEVMSFVAGKVAPHKKVRIVEFIDEIPKSASGKILRKDLRTRENV